MGQGHARRHLVRTLNVETLGLELADQEAQQGVVATAGRGDRPRQRLEPTPVGLEGREVRPLDDPGQADRFDTGGLERREALAQLGDARLDSVEGFERWVGHAFQSDHEQRAADRLALPREADR